MIKKSFILIGTMEAEPVLLVKDLSTYLQIGAKEVAVVDKVSFHLYPGKTLALVGESGCGKTMTALSIMRIVPSPPLDHISGEAIYRGKNLLAVSEKEMRTIRGGRIAMIFQDPASSLNPVYTIGTQLVETAELHLNLYGDAAIEKAAKALSDVHIPDPFQKLNEYPHQMSGGMRQRVMIAMALMCEPDILIADEPTTALDVTIQAQVLDLIRELQERRKMSVLLITHDMGVVAELADDMIVMYAAQDVERGEVHEIFDNMAHPYTMGLFHSRAQGALRSERLPAIKGSVPSPINFPKGCRFHPRCPYVMEKCKHRDVPDFLVAEPNHTAKCLLHDGTEESMAKIAREISKGKL